MLSRSYAIPKNARERAYALREASGFAVQTIHKICDRTTSSVNKTHDWRVRSRS
ncbi:hypothetical protein [Tolypothrix sp. NIES-4075]|uniref:hypothetical protein n=1 Tax=Tolypothrix sp. NIES-4075 TaxID=2005459 RepID=UPI0013589EDA|nr:hypothetical protein [Tolypothrix sp. NIES-4075]